MLGGIASQREVFSYMRLCFSADFLCVNLTSESSFFTRPTGYPLDVRRVSKFLICPSNVFSEEFVLRILNASPLINTFLAPGGRHE